MGKSMKNWLRSVAAAGVIAGLTVAPASGFAASAVVEQAKGGHAPLHRPVGHGALAAAAHVPFDAVGGVASQGQIDLARRPRRGIGPRRRRLLLFWE